MDLVKLKKLYALAQEILAECPADFDEYTDTENDVCDEIKNVVQEIENSGLLNKEYCASIKDLASGLYIVSVEGDEIELGPEENRLLFYNEADAENVLDMGNDLYKACFILITE